MRLLDTPPLLGDVYKRQVSGSGAFKGEVTYYGSEIVIGSGSSAGYHNYEGGLNAWGGVHSVEMAVIMGMPYCWQT